VAGTANEGVAVYLTFECLEGATVDSFLSVKNKPKFVNRKLFQLHL